MKKMLTKFQIAMAIIVMFTSLIAIIVNWNSNPNVSAWASNTLIWSSLYFGEAINFNHLKSNTHD